MRGSEHNAKPAQLWVERLKWGLGWGLVYVAAFGGFAVLLRALDGPRSFVEHGTSLTAFLEAYVATGIVGGLFLGLVKPWLRCWAGSALVGLLTGSLVGFALLISNNGLRGWSSFDFVLPGAFGLCGCVTGAALNRKAKQLGKL